MENITLAPNFTNSCFYDENKKIRFDPPVYEQRYWTIIHLLELDYWKDSFKKVLLSRRETFSLDFNLPLFRRSLSLAVPR